MLELLFKKYRLKTKVKKLRITFGKTGRSFGGPRLQIGLRQHWSLPLEDVVLHEFAHVLEYWKQGDKRISKIKQGNSKRTVHDAGFARILEKIVETWYGNWESYKWEGDYKNVYKAHLQHIRAREYSKTLASNELG